MSGINENARNPDATWALRTATDDEIHKQSDAAIWNIDRAIKLTPDDWAAPLSWVDRILARLAERGAADPSRIERDKPLRQLFVHLRGSLLYRAGRPEEAAPLLRDPASLHPLDNEIANWVFLALAEHRLGHADAAKVAATKARTIQAKSKPDGVWDKAEVELLAAELDADLPVDK